MHRLWKPVNSRLYAIYANPIRIYVVRYFIHTQAIITSQYTVPHGSYGKDYQYYDVIINSHESALLYELSINHTWFTGMT